MTENISETYEYKLLSELVSIKSVTGNAEGYKKMGEKLKDELESLGLEVKIYDGGVEARDGVPRPNVVAFLDAGSEYTLGILTHYDVVDAGGKWIHEPFSLTMVEEGGEIRLYGRGSADDKGCMVGAISAVRELVERGKKPLWNLALMMVADEEVGGKYGAGFLARNKVVDLDALLVADSSSMGLVIGASGIIHGKIKVKGIQGHAGYIIGTDNALQKAITFLKEMEDFITIRSIKQSVLKNPPEIKLPKLWGRFSLTWIKTPNAIKEIYNMVPGDVEVGFDMRLIPDEELERAEAELISFFEMTKHKTGIHDVELEIVKKVNGWMTPPDHPFVKLTHKALTETTRREIPIMGMLGGNDGSWFREYGIPIISYGVWDKKSMIHGVNESASLERIIDLKEFIIKILTEIDPRTVKKDVT